MEEIVKDCTKDFWELVNSYLTPNDISACIAQSDLASMLLCEMYNKGISRKSLAKQLGISKRKLGKLIDGELDIPLSLIEKICDVCGMQFKIEFERASK